jgi:hypothetical protein
MLRKYINWKTCNLWENNITINSKGSEALAWIYVASDSFEWWTFVNTVMTL